MSEVFSAKRFGLLVKKTIRERPLHTAGVAVLLLVLSLMLYIVSKKLGGFAAAQNLTFIWGLAGGGFVMSSFVFGYFGTNASGCSYLTLPVSFVEKWLVSLLIAGILYPLLFLIFYHVVDVAFVNAYHHGLDRGSLFYQQQYESVSPFNLNGIVAWKVYSLFLTLTGAMLVGGLYFNKLPFIKTCIALCLLVGCIVGLNWLIALVLFNNLTAAGPYDHVELAVGRETGVLQLSDHMENVFHAFIAFIIPCVLWILPLFRLREKEF